LDLTPITILQIYGSHILKRLLIGSFLHISRLKVWKLKNPSMRQNWKVQQETLQGYEANDKIQAGFSGNKLCKDRNGKVLVENDQLKEVWRQYMEKLLNEENAMTWDNVITYE